MSLTALIYYDAIVATLAIAANCLILVAICSATSLRALTFRSSRSRQSSHATLSRRLSTQQPLQQQQVFYRFFLISLAACDLFTSTVHVLAIAFKIAVSKDDVGVNTFLSSWFFISTCSLPTIMRTLQLSGFFTNLANLCAMSIDHFVSVSYPFRYRNFMTERIARTVVLSIWVASFCLAFADLPVSWFISPTKPTSPAAAQVLSNQQTNETRSTVLLDKHEIANNTLETTSNYSWVILSFLQKLREEDAEQEDRQKNSSCPTIVNKMWFELAVICFVVVCLFLLIFCYSVIFKKVARRLVNPFDRRKDRLIRTTLVFIGVFSLCWLPFITFEFILFVGFQQDNDISSGQGQLRSMMIFHSLLMSLMRTYPLLDPFIYAVRVPACQTFLIDLGLRCVPCKHKTAERTSNVSGRLLLKNTVSNPVPDEELCFRSSEVEVQETPNHTNNQQTG